MLAPIDKNGKKLIIGIKVRMSVAPNDLLSGLPDEDQSAIREIVGKELKVRDFDEYGHVELWFTDKEEAYHSIWVRPSDLVVVGDML